MTQIIIVEDTKLNLLTDEKYEFLLSNKDVALGYGITPSTLRSNQNNHKDELIENKHWLRLEIQTKGGKQKVIHWTKKGIVRLGFFIKSEKAKAFRDWAEDYIIQGEEPKPIKDDNTDIKNILGNIANSLEQIAKNTTLQNKSIIINPEETKTLEDAETLFKVSKPNKNDNLENKKNFYQNILKVIAKYPDGVSQRILLSEAGHSQSNKTRRWLQEQISILWDMTIIPGKCYKYVLKDNK